VARAVVSAVIGELSSSRSPLHSFSAAAQQAAGGARPAPAIGG
jgi:hypothetical protein